jgi:hypothetical protein
MTGMCWKSVVKEGQLTNQRSVGRSVRRTDGFIAFTPESKQESHASKCRESAVQLARFFILTHAEPYNNITSPAAGDCFERSISGWERASALGLQDPFSCLFYFLSGRTELIFILHFFPPPRLTASAPRSERCICGGMQPARRARPAGCISAISRSSARKRELSRSLVD